MLGRTSTLDFDDVDYHLSHISYLFLLSWVVCISSSLLVLWAPEGQGLYLVLFLSIFFSHLTFSVNQWIGADTDPFYRGRNSGSERNSQLVSGIHTRSAGLQNFAFIVPSAENAFPLYVHLVAAFSSSRSQFQRYFLRSGGPGPPGPPGPPS